jgi:hypothetical protein
MKKAKCYPKIFEIVLANQAEMIGVMEYWSDGVMVSG